jgi:CheY-like chemotaxis protein
MDDNLYSMPYYSPYVDPMPSGTPQLGSEPTLGIEQPAKDLLIVEDEQALCDLLADVLEGEGYVVRKSGNGLDALHLIRERRPNLIFLDMMMPVMDGWQFLEELRANPKWADIPVVLMTAVYDMSSLETRTGARAILSKPFDIELIIEAVGLFAD